jgi:hypothetical protein
MGNHHDANIFGNDPIDDAVGFEKQSHGSPKVRQLSAAVLSQRTTTCTLQPNGIGDFLYVEADHTFP